MIIAIDAIDELSVHAADAVNRYLTYCQPDDPAAHVQANLGTIRALADAAITDVTGTVLGRPRVHNVTLLRDGGVRVTFDSSGTTERTVPYAPSATPAPEALEVAAHILGHVAGTVDELVSDGDGTGTGGADDTESAPTPAPAPTAQMTSGVTELATVTPITQNAGRRRDHKATYERRNQVAIGAGYSSYRARRIARATGIGLLTVDAS